MHYLQDLQDHLQHHQNHLQDHQKHPYEEPPLGGFTCVLLMVLVVSLMVLEVVLEVLEVVHRKPFWYIENLFDTLG